jgi:hypothetical protein
VLLGLLVLKEKLNGKEWLAIALAVAAVGNELATLGTLPWISLFLAATFGSYGLLRKQVPVDAISGLCLETLAMLPLCLIYTLWQAQHGHFVFALAGCSTPSSSSKASARSAPRSSPCAGWCRMSAAPSSSPRRPSASSCSPWPSATPRAPG